MARTNKPSETEYSGKELIKAQTGIERDILSVILDPKKYYTLSQVKAIKQKYLNKEAK